MHLNRLNTVFASKSDKHPTKEGEQSSPSFVAGAAQSLEIDLQAASGLERVLNLAASPLNQTFRLCSQIRTGEMLEMFTKLWYNEKKKAISPTNTAKESTK